MFLPSYFRFISKMILIRNLVARTIKYDDIDWLSFSILDQKPDRNANESTRTMERTTDVLSPSLSPQPSTRSIFYRITGIVASVPIRLYLPRGGHRSLSSLPLALPVNTIPRGLNIDCDSDL